MNNPKPEARSPNRRAVARQFSIPNLPLPLLLAALCASTVLAADYSIDWFTIDGGGGTSTNGQYSLTGTIGQPDTGAMTGGNFTLQGGFWGVIAAVQTEGAPLLSVTNLGSHVLVSWSAPADGWLLERTNVLTGMAGPWTPMSPPYQTNGGVISVNFTNTPPTGNQFFRLHK